MTAPNAPDMLTQALAHGIRPGLERITALLDRLDRPQDRHPVIHVAGTNGKGSTCAMLASVLGRAGLRVGRYTSPHLISYTERMWAAGRFIDESELSALLERVNQAAEQLDASLGPVTEFELLTAVTFVWFATLPLDVVLLEVGLGGRLDATNVVPDPVLTVITRIARDHTALLGDSLDAIAREKAGILKPGRPLVTGAEAEALAAIREQALAVGSPLVQAPESRWLGPGSHGDRVELGGRPFELGLIGAYQAQNAAIALQAVEQLRAQGWKIPEEALVEGLAGARWPGRLDRWQDARGERFLVDGAHNLDGVQALARALADRPEPEGRVIVFGVLSDKETEPMVEAIAPHAATLILTMPPSPRAQGVEALGCSIRHPDLRRVPDPLEALNLARACARGREVVVAGSLYLVGAAYQALDRAVEA